MRHIIRLTSCAVLAALSLGARADDHVLLWYDKPATDWEKEALPIGNGRIGAMVFGGVDSERLQISEKSLWTGGPGSEGGYDYGLPADSQAALDALASANNSSTARSSSPKTWPNSSAARCTTTATTRASAISSSSASPDGSR